MKRNLRIFVRDRAAGYCEYCQLHEDYDSYYAFHIEHIIARQHGGSTDPENLAWSCHNCNLYKGPNLTGVDPRTGRLIQLFHPRRDNWKIHFRWEGPILIGRTAVGRATVAVLQFNRDDRIELRRLLLNQGLPLGTGQRSERKTRSR
jgi:HNH endonuclease